MSAYTCTCPWTPERMWLSAASCGYGSGYEPGSQREYDPGCPEHGDGTTIDREVCPTCDDLSDIVEVGYEEQIIPDRRISGPPAFRTYHVTRLACGHEIAAEAKG